MKRLTIDNPLPGSNGRIRPNAAARAVKAGRAVYSSPTSITLLDNAFDDAERHIADAWLWRRSKDADADAERKLHYDRIDRPMRLDEIANIPVVNASKLLIGKQLAVYK